MTERGVSSRVISPLDFSASEISTWERLLVSGVGISSPFLSYHYARAVAEAGMDVRVCLLYESDRIIGFFPFQFANRIAAILKAGEPVGGGMTDYFGLIAESDTRINPEQLLRHARLNYLGFSHLDESQFGYGLSGEAPRTGLRTLIESTPAALIESIDSKHKKYLRDAIRLERKLNEDVGPVRFVADELNGRDEKLTSLVEEKRKQYRRTNVSDALRSQWKRSLMHVLAAYNFSDCRGVLSTLYAGEDWVARHFGLLGNGIFQYWFPVYNPTYSKYAPGRLLSLALLKNGDSMGYTVFDNGEGETDEKRRLANSQHFYYRGAWHNDTLLSLSQRCIKSFKWRLLKS